MSSLNTIGAIALSAAAAAVGYALIAAGLRTWPARLKAGGVLAAWFVIVAVAAGSRVFSQRFGLGLPALGIAVAMPIALALLFAAYAPRLRTAIRGVPLPVLVGVNTVRVLGILFVLLYLASRLPAPFAPTAGYGDIAIGVTAPFVAWMASRHAAGWRALAWIWNALGLLDLAAAVGLAVLTTNGSPVRLFFTTPGTEAMTNLPWILIPGFLVPLLALTHLAIFDGLWRRGGVGVVAGRVATVS